MEKVLSLMEILSKYLDLNLNWSHVSLTQRLKRSSSTVIIVASADNTLTEPYSLALWGPISESVESCKAVFGDNIAVFSNSAGLEEYDPDGRKGRAVEYVIGIRVIRHMEKLRLIQMMLWLLIMTLIMILMIPMIRFRIALSHDPTIVLAKAEANAEENKELAGKYEVQGFPTIKIFRSNGEKIQEYNGPREADGIVTYLKKQVGPASNEIKTTEDVENFIDEKKIFVVGIFPKFSGEEFESFMNLAEKMRSNYDFGHTTNAKLISRGESSVTKPTLRLLKPFDELFVDFKKFDVDAMEKFIGEASTPLVTLFDQSPDNQPFISKYFDSSDSKAMLFLDFSHEQIESFKSKYHEVAGQYNGKGLIFLMGNVPDSQNALEYFGLKEEQTPAIVVQNADGLKYINQNVQFDQIAPWLKDFTDGKLKPFIKSEAIPETNDEPVKVVVSKSLRDMFLDSKKNVLLEIYAPWCGHCKQLAPILEEVAVSFENDDGVVIAKLDGTQNDIPSDTFDVKGYPTMFFRSSNGNVVQYDGDRTKEDIIEFIHKNRDTTSESSPESVLKDEL